MSVKLPPFTFRGPHHGPPFRHEVVLEKVIGKVRFTITSNPKETRWWFTASQVGVEMFARRSNGLTTSSLARATEWVIALRSGDVELADDY